MRLISLNIQGDLHLERVVPFLKREAADVVCLQEVHEKDAGMIADALGVTHAFLPMVNKKRQDTGEWHPEGIAIFSGHPIHKITGDYYHRPDAHKILDFVYGDDTSKRSNIAQCYLVAEIELFSGAAPTRIVNTHFTWSFDGSVSDHQREDAQSLLDALAHYGDMVLCGDFNVPRGDNEIYAMLTQKFADTIPHSYKTSLDPLYHRAYAVPEQRARVERCMVDYLFVTPGYTATDVALQFGLSDHAAVIGTVTSA